MAKWNGKEIVQKIYRDSQTEFFDTRGSREQYAKSHGCVVLTTECMDGRMNVARITNAPVGLMKQFRSIGGIMDLEWPILRKELAYEIDMAAKQGLRVVVIITNHFSDTDPHWGCAGCNYDVSYSEEVAWRFYQQIKEEFAGREVFPFFWGVETDWDSITLNGEPGSGESVRLASLSDRPEAIPITLNALYSSVPRDIREALIPFIAGNIEYNRSLLSRGRSALEMQHGEWAVAVGSGFEWLRKKNRALIINPLLPDLEASIATAAKIVVGNMEAGRIPNEGFLLMTSSLHGAGRSKGLAEARSNAILQYSLNILFRSLDSEQFDLVHTLPTVIDMQTMTVTSAD